MNTPPRNLPRFLPTLTEVVRPSELSEPSSTLPPDSDALVQALQAQVDNLVKARFQQELERLVHSVVVERANTLSSDLRTELREEVRRMVSEAYSAQNDSNKLKS